MSQRVSSCHRSFLCSIINVEIKAKLRNLSIFICMQVVEINAIQQTEKYKCSYLTTISKLLNTCWLGLHFHKRMLL